MRYPTLMELDRSEKIIDVFKGYNHNLRIGDGEFYNMKNLTSTKYPVLSPRQRRGIYAYIDSPQGLIQKDTLCYVDRKYFVVDGYRVDMGLSTAPEDCPKQLISMGAYVIIMPDKKYINISNLTDFGSIEASVTTNSTVTFEMSKVDGGVYSEEGVVASDEAPDNPSNMDLWIDTSSTPHTLKQWSSTSAVWVNIATTYVKISAAGIGKAFEAYDGVTISGIENKQLSDLNNTMVIWSKGDDYIVVTGILDEISYQDTPITITRKMPNMDFVIESENRLWGCRYGVALNGEVVNEIYASKLGDFKNWNCFMGLSTDSYAATVGSDGQFTGAITHLGYPLFFKENCMHKVYGNYPANYQIATTACRGVQKGCHKSLAIVNEKLYYKSRNAVCVYDGSLPQEISYALGDVAYGNAVACAHGNKYYISMRDDSTEVMWSPSIISGNTLLLKQAYFASADGNHLKVDIWESPTQKDKEISLTQAYAATRISGVLFIDKGDTDAARWNLFVYDTAKGLWHREDNTRAVDFCSCRGELYYIDHYDNQKIKTMFGSGYIDSAKVDWMAETGIIGVDSPRKRYISKLNLRMNLAIDTRIRVSIQYDSIGEWIYVCSYTGVNHHTISIPIHPRRCDHLRLRIEGSGEADLFAVTETIEEGSDV